ncbi:MAG: formate--tetrahydrofolate ligase [Oscillospiraceae bacterium]
MRNSAAHRGKTPSPPCGSPPSDRYSASRAARPAAAARRWSPWRTSIWISTCDFHAIGEVQPPAAMLDNHIQQGNRLGIDVKRIVWKRCVDMNDRQLRNIVDGLGRPDAGRSPGEDGFDITVASEVMAVLCLARISPHLKAALAG